MRFRAFITLLLFVSACATSAPRPRAPAARETRLANLQRAAALPWMDGGRCVVQEASQSWPVLVERCFHALDHDRLEFHDPTGRCAVASAGAVAVGLGVCVLAAPEIVAGAVIVAGVVVVGFAIHEALDAYELSRDLPEVRPVTETPPVPETTTAPQESSLEQRPKPEPKGPDFPPPEPPEISERERRRKCEPIPGPPRGGNDLHNQCANNIPGNTFPGSDVFVNGKNFDALQLAKCTLWEVKTDAFDKHSLRSRRFLAEVKLPEIRREKILAEACGYHFVVGVRSQAHKDTLLELDPDLDVVVMVWC